MSPLLHHLDALRRLQCANQHSFGKTLLSGHDIKAVMHAIGEINVGIAARTEHHGVALGLAAKGMAGLIVLAIGLGFDDNPGGRVSVAGMHELASEQRLGETDSILSEK